MAEDVMNLRALVKKSADADLLRPCAREHVLMVVDLWDP